MELKKVYIADTNCITPLGFDVNTNIDAIEKGTSGIELHNNSMMPSSFYAGIIDDTALNNAFSAISTNEKYTRLEKMMLLALHPVIKQSDAVLNNKTVLVVSTTKGNITALADSDTDKAGLYDLASTIATFFGFTTTPVVVSNACVSGIMAVSVTKRLLQSGMYDNAFIVSGDEVSEFVLSGFNSFQAMSNAPCKPYSANRTGVNIGEAAAAALVTVNSNEAVKAEIAGDGSVNDANHISGPSRTGEGLVRSIESALKEANTTADKIDYISAHGTATPYNDEMEAIAFNRLALQDVPVNSLKGYYGHTLGASGLLETVIGLESMQRSRLYTSAGYDEPGVSQPINVITQNTDKPIAYFLKTASGFGGCNTAVVFKKAER